MRSIHQMSSKLSLEVELRNSVYWDVLEELMRFTDKIRVHHKEASLAFPNHLVRFDGTNQLNNILAIESFNQNRELTYNSNVPHFQTKNT
jgi:hypothetical protein